MNKTQARYFLTGLMAAGLLALAACSSQQEPAQQAFSAADSALAAVREDAGRYVPDQLTQVEASLSHLKTQLEKKDYRSVLAGASGLNASIARLKDEAASRRADYEAEWDMFEGDLGSMVEAIQSRVDTLSKARRLPANLTRDAFDGAKAGLDELKATVESAKTAFEGGNALDAVTIAKGAQAKGREVLALLGMSGN